MASGTADRLLIVNADDFGQDPAFNRGTALAHDHGIVTSASLMVRWPASQDAADRAAQRPGLSLGLHLDLGEWTCRDGTWEPLYTVADVTDRAVVEREVDRQLGLFHELVGAAPTHLDSHQHVHRDEPVRGVLTRAARELGVPLREGGSVGYCGRFYGQSGTGLPYPGGVTVASLVAVLGELPEGSWELSCHPADAECALGTMYRTERVTELASLCDPAVARAVQDAGLTLASFTQVAR